MFVDEMGAIKMDGRTGRSEAGSVSEVGANVFIRRGW